VSGAQTPTAPRQRSGLVFAVLGLACFWYSLMQAIVAPVLHDIQIDLDTSAAASAWLVSGFMLATVVAIPVLGRLGDMFGKRRLMILCLAILLVGLCVSALADSIEGMIAGRVLQGLGGAVFPLSFGIARDVFPPERLAGAVALLSGTVGFGGAGGVVAAGLIADHLSLRWLFLLPAIGVAAALAGAIAFVPESRLRSPGRVDVAGAVMLAAWLLALLLAITQGNPWGWASWRVLGLFAGAVVVLAVWIAFERRTPEPLVEMRMLRERGVWTANLAGLTFGFGMYATFLLVPLLAQQPDSTPYGLGQSATRAVMYLLPSQSLMLLASPVSGWLAGRFGPRVPLAIGAACGTASFVFLSFLHDAPAHLFTGSILMGLGLGLGWPAMANAVVAAVPPQQTGIATGMNTIARTIGGAIGTQVAATAVAATLDVSGFPAENGFVVGFVLSAVALVITLGASLAMPPLRRAPAAAALP
jgi:EmrB/QacA subfamily drug resistance transporter